MKYIFSYKVSELQLKKCCSKWVELVSTDNRLALSKCSLKCLILSKSDKNVIIYNLVCDNLCPQQWDFSPHLATALGTIDLEFNLGRLYEVCNWLVQNKHLYGML